VSTLRALPVVLIIASGPTAALADVRRSPGDVRPRSQLTCFPIRPGDTAAGLAERFTGDIHNRQQPWFQIVNTATRSVLPKSRYDEIEPGWRVCVAAEMLRSGLLQPRYVPISSTSLPMAQSLVGATAVPVDFRFLWWMVPLAMAASGFGLVWAWKSADERRVRAAVMRGFGERFVHEFARPLCRNATAPPIRSRLRFARRSIEILIAPAGGRTYPNLADHVKNVEYDVERVLRLLNEDAFSAGPLYAEGPWVVIRFRIETDKPQEGVL
jgi:hypothetical protein